MTTSSMLLNQPYDRVRKPIHNMLEDKGFDLRGISYDKTVNQHMTRAAQADGDPQLSWKEAVDAVERLATGRAPARLPGNDRHMSFVVEDKLDMGGWSGERRGFWEPTIHQAAKKAGVSVKLEAVPGTERRPGLLSRLLGVSDRATYRITAEGSRDQVEAFFDAYHAARLEFRKQHDA